MVDKVAEPVAEWGENAPLADRMRPLNLEEVIGQEHLTAPGRILFEAVRANRYPSMIFWGPPGCGKTTLARVISRQGKRRFFSLSAVFSGVKEVREVVAQAGALPEGAILFMDEIHRFNKGQQDAFLPFVENGTITLIGATTENPSFELNGALLSRCRVLVLNPLGAEALGGLVRRALADRERGYGGLELTVDPAVVEGIAASADGDARHALNLLETLVALSQARGIATLGVEQLALVERRALQHDKHGESHFNLISALHKSLRGSDPDAALYWLARMLVGGEDGLYIARRLVRFACEDVGNADPAALGIALDARDAYHFLGAPEGELALAQAVIYLATAPKSNAIYTAYGQARECATAHGSLPPPLSIRNAPTRLLRELGYGADYRYPHDYEHGCVAAEYFPDSLAGTRFYHPVERGFEREVIRRLVFWRRLKGGAT